MTVLLFIPVSAGLVQLAQDGRLWLMIQHSAYILASCGVAGLMLQLVVRRVDLGAPYQWICLGLTFAGAALGALVLVAAAIVRIRC